MPTIIETIPLNAANDIRTLNLDIPLIAKKALVEVSFDAVDDAQLTGLVTTDFVNVVKPTLDNGLRVVSTRVPAADSVSITFFNPTNNDIDPAAQDILLFVG